MINDRRIKELAEQAGFENGHQDRDGRSLAYELEKFAELIVQDICDWIDKSDSLPSKSIITTNIKSRYISKHFGVEE